MKWWRHSLYTRVSGVYLLLLVMLGILLMVITGRSYMHVTAEADQKLNRTLAENLAKEFTPFIQPESLDMEGVKEMMHYLMVMNPRVEIYLLDETGRVLAFFADPAKIKQDQVDLRPVQAFLGGPLTQPLLGDDPRNPGQTKPFSVAPIQIDTNRTGFLYVILAGEQYHSALNMVQDSAIVRITFTVVLLAIAFTALVGLVLFSFLTKRFHTMTEVVQQFEGGDFSRRIPIHSSDEVGRLGKAFNQMADTIEASVEELRRGDDLRRELIANVSHDLRSPLASIQGYVETILMKDLRLDPAERARFLDIILDNTTRLSRLVDELFELSKLDAHQVEPEREAFSVAELTQDVVMKFKPQADQRAVSLDADLSPALPMAYADIGMIDRVLSNLLDNALRYTPARGHVHVGLAPDRDGVRVSVSDTGSGIPPEDLPHVLERFYRVEKSRVRDTGGSGLGLAIASKILELHNSHLDIESATGQGTTVSFCLPTQRA